MVRVRGSHRVLKHSDGRTVVVPIHSGETIGPGLFRKILRDRGIDRDEFYELLG